MRKAAGPDRRLHRLIFVFRKRRRWWEIEICPVAQACLLARQDSRNAWRVELGAPTAKPSPLVSLQANSDRPRAAKAGRRRSKINFGICAVHFPADAPK